MLAPSNLQVITTHLGKDLPALRFAPVVSRADLVPSPDCPDRGAAGTSATGSPRCGKTRSGAAARLSQSRLRSHTGSELTITHRAGQQRQPYLTF